MQILVTGAAGFLGRRLIEALLAEPDGLPHISRIVAADVTRCPIDDRRIAHRQGTITEVDFVALDRRARHRRRVPPGRCPERPVGSRVRYRHAGQRRCDEDPARGVPRPPPPSAGGVREHRRRVRRRVARDRIRGRRREAAVVLRNGEGHRRAARERVLAPGLHRRDRLPRGHCRHQAGQAELRPVVVRQRYRPGASCGHRDGVPGASRHASVDQFARDCHDQSGPRRPSARSGPRTPYEC